MSKTIGFIGLGLIGGSIARALRRTHPEYRLIAYNRTKESLIAALSDGVLNQATDSIDAAFADCDFIFLCMPVSVNIRCLKQLKSIIRPDCIITDVGSVKSSIHDAVTELGMDANFIGGHPMAGSEKTGYTNSHDHLLENAYYIITPTAVSEAEKIEELRALVSDTGALPVIIPPKEHDFATANISHLPHVIAFTLVNLVRQSDNPDGLMRQLAAGGFRDITRIASSSPDMWESICLENKEQLLMVIDSYKDSLQTVADAIASDAGDTLHDLFDSAKDYRDNMPIKTGTSMNPVYEIYVDIIDVPGAIATLSTILAANNISIKNIGILHNREYQDGVLRVEFYDNDAVERAAAILSKLSYSVHCR